jgi:MFS family permease
MSQMRLIGCVLLPFAAGYYLSYLFRTINALIAADLSAELNLNAADLGLLTSVYFLVLAAVQLPLGALLDRHGPKTIQSALLLLASGGALLFALADGLLGLLVGRVLLGLGVALALMAGFKAIVTWFPPGRIALVNGWLVMLGALGAVTATTPSETIVRAVGWRGLFAILAGFCALAALLVLFAVPEQSLKSSAQSAARAPSLWTIYRDRRFWRIAPLSATGIASSWSLQGLWAAPWLCDVAGLDRTTVVHYLAMMAIVVCASALLLGMVADRLRRRGVRTEVVLATMLALSMMAQAALVFGWPIPSHLLWALIAGAGAATVLSFAIIADYFPREASGRANAALNLLHVGSAFVLQSATGFIIARWPETQGSYPAEAHQAAMATILVLQLVAFAWFAASPQLSPTPTPRALFGKRRTTQSWASTALSAYTSPAMAWMQHAALVRQQARSWRLAAIGSLMLCVGLAAALSMSISRPALAIHIYEGHRVAQIPFDPPRLDLATLRGHSLELQLARGAVPWRAPNPIMRPTPAMLVSTARSQ